MASMFALFSLIILACRHLVQGHGRMLDPVSRSTMWRYGFDTPHNFDDTSIDCGGFDILYNKNGGKCGPCGDNYSDFIPRRNELGGYFGDGIVVVTYLSGSNVPFLVQLTASAKGSFHFDLCDNSNGEPETEDCFVPLLLANGEYEVKVPTFDPQNITSIVSLPEGFACERCTIRWHYKGGNNVGSCGNGTSSVDCADQEIFRNCADVQILENSS